MRAVVVRELGDPLPQPGERQPLQYEASWPEPELKDPRAVKIRVAAGALNFADTLQVKGTYQEKAKLPFVPGGEVSGTVTEVGPKVKSLKLGDRVCALSGVGAFAEVAIVPEASALKLPESVELEAAAGLPVAFGTAHMALAHRARLRRGQTVLILGAAGGVGIAAVQVAKVMGAVVIALCRGSEKADALRQLGADHVIDTAASQAPLRQQLKASAPKGLDVIFDLVGGEPFREALKAARWGAHILFIGFASGDVPKVAANIALVKNWTLHGVYWGSYARPGNDPLLLQQSLLQLVAWLAEGKIHVPVSHRVPLERVADAYKALLTRQNIGKVLVLPGQGASRL